LAEENTYLFHPHLASPIKGEENMALSPLKGEEYEGTE